MKVLQDALEQTLADSYNELLARLIASKVEAQGTTLSADDRKSLAEQIGANGGSELHLPGEGGAIELKLSKEEREQLTARAGEMNAIVESMIEPLSEKLAAEMLSDLKSRWKEHAKLVRTQTAGFTRRLYKRWGLGIERMYMLVEMCREVGADINDEISRSKEFRKQRHLFDVMRRSHARACQVALEVVTLLEAGFADGAMARWRTLHELVVTTAFILDGGEELAERYVRHSAVESKKAADEYQQRCARLNYKPLTSAEMGRIKKAFDAAVAKYGKPFKESYGWAAARLKNPRPNFAEIEKAANRGHMRSHYRLASHGVHANAKGVFSQLGNMKAGAERVLAAGPSNAGLLEPAQCTALSLVQMTALMCTLQPTLDNNVAMRALDNFAGEVTAAFVDAHEQLVKDEELCAMADDAAHLAAKKHRSS